MIRSSISPIQRRNVQKPAQSGDILAMLQELLASAPQILKAHAEMKQMHDNIKSYVESIKQGPPGPPGTPGRHAEPPQIDYDRIVSLVSNKIKLPKDGKDGKHGRDAKTPSVDEIVNALLGSKRLTLDEIVGLRPHLNNLQRAIMRGGGDTVAAGTGVSITQSNGVKTITVSGVGTKVRDEVPSGSGTSFTLAHTPLTNTLQLFRGGARQQVGAGKDYTVSGTAITLAQTLASGEILLADYEY